MKNGYLKVCAATIDIQVGNPVYNSDRMIEKISDYGKEKIKLIVFPELGMTGYTCSDLFLQDILLEEAEEGLRKIAEVTKNYDMVVAAGLPYMKDGKLFNVAAILFHGKVLGFIPKKYIPNYSEFYEARHFCSGSEKIEYIKLNWQEELVPFGIKLLFRCTNMKEFVLGAEICEDLWVPIPPSSYHAQAGATVIINMSASDEITGKDKYRSQLVEGQSGKLICGYLYSDAGEGESSTDLVFAGHNIIAENGIIIKESERFQNESAVSEIDLQKIANERRRMTTYDTSQNKEGYVYVDFSFSNIEETSLTRKVDKNPFVPKSKGEREKRCKEILCIQASGLKKRLAHTKCKTAVIGISGGLDSTLALLVTAQAFDMLGLDRKNMIAVTMPCFGTTDRTYENAVHLSRILGATLKEIPINDAVTLHLQEIGHDKEVHDVTYENAQARMRTLVLMNTANQMNGLVIGTGDMSELALGWATYNGDHMSMYGVNVSVPKTLVRYLVMYYADTTETHKLSEILYDVLDTPVSPELLPPKDGMIAQKTEDIVGPYELHDFFLYYILRFGFKPQKVFRLAKEAYGENYDLKIIYKWLNNFYCRFFSQQFKRSCLPDGPKVGSVAVSPRGDLRMPSDASREIWIHDLKELEEKYGTGF